MKAYMMADLNNPTSVRYTEIALKSWENKTPLDIEVVQCYTPNTISELEPLYNWQPLLHHGQQKENLCASPTEKSGDITHWQFIKKRSESKSRFYVLEHDAYLEDADEFKRQFDFTMEHGLSYANHGLYMSCYSFSRVAAIHIHDLLTQRAFPLNGGPFGCVERLVKTYLTEKPDRKAEYTWMMHHPNTDRVSVGHSAEEMFNTYNFKKLDTPFKRASTQIISKSIGITQNHIGLTQSKRHGFKLID